MKSRLDMDKIARGLRAEWVGTVTASGGHFGAMQLVADVKERFRVPSGGGRRTDPRRTEPVSYTHLDVYKRQGRACSS